MSKISADTVNKYTTAVMAILAKSFGPPKRQDHRPWAEWVNHDRSDQTDRRLVALLNTTAHDRFKARALVIMMAPAPELEIFYWHQRTARESLDLVHLLLEPGQLSPQLMRFYCELLCLNVDTVRDDFKDDRDMQHWRYDYEKFILQLLPFLDPNDELAKRVFARYEPRRLSSILIAPVPDVWKQRTDDLARAQVEAWLIGRAQSRTTTDSRDPLAGYISALEVTAKYSNCSRDLLAAQIQFVLGLPGIDDRPTFRSPFLADLFKQLAGDQHRDLRHRLARHVILKPQPDRQCYPASEMMLAEFKDDSELVAILEPFVAAIWRQTEEREAAARLQEQHEASLIRRLS